MSAETTGNPIPFDGPANGDSPYNVFLWSFFMIVVSEIGDKTFFIAAVLAMNNSRFLVFISAFAALFTMTVLSVIVGHVAPLLFSKVFSQFAAGILFIIFGIKMLLETREMTGNEGQEELLEVVNEIEKSDTKDKLLEQGELNVREEARPSKLFGIIPKVCVQGFVMTFLGEWGDRSQIATVAMAGAQNFVWVCIGSLTGHALCTGIAVIGGRMLASRISVKTVNITGGILFLLFGIVALFECLSDGDYGRISMKSFSD